MLEILGRATSSNVQAVMWLVAELELAHNRQDYGGAFGGTDSADFLAMNPMGRVPVLRDGDVTLFESQAILRYLAARYGSPAFWPDDPDQRAPVDQWMEWAKVNIYPVLTYKVFWQLIRTTAADRDHALIAEGAEELASLMAIAETQIAKQGWLASDHMTLADISFGTHLYRYFNIPFERGDFPALEDYYHRLTTRPAYAAHVMVSFDSLRVEGA